MSQQAIAAIEAGNVMRPTKLLEIARTLGVTPDYLLGLSEDGARRQRDDGIVVDEWPEHESPRIYIPDLAIFGGMGGGGALEIIASENGVPADHLEQIRGYWQFPEYLIAGFQNIRKIHAWEARGDSMEPTIFGGSVVFVDTSQNQLPPNDIYAINYGDGLMVKRLKLIPRTDRVEVISDNPRYRPDEMLREEVQVFGRIVGTFQWRH